MNNNDLLKRAHQCESERNNVQTVWDAITEFVLPYRGNFFGEHESESSIDWYGSRFNFDSTASSAHSRLAASIGGNLTPASIQWFMMRFRSDRLNKDKQAAGWLQEASARTWYEIQDSNFNLEADECYQDITGFGTGFLTLEEERKANKWSGLDFSSVPLKESFFEADHKSRVHRYYRKLQWTAQQIITKFDEKGVPQSILDANLGKGSTEKHDVWFCVFPRRDAMHNLTNAHRKMSKSRRPWGYKYILNADATTLGEEGGYYDMPTYAVRWRKSNDSIWGNGPAHMVLGDIMALNRGAEIQENVSEKMADPPMLAEERSLITDLGMESGDLSVVNRIDGIRALDFECRPDYLDARMDRLMESVKQHFFSDQLIPPPPQGTPMSATEWAGRVEFLQRLLGPSTGRIQNDMLNPTVSRTFRMLMREGEIPQPPAIVVDQNANLDIEYLGPLARAQRMDSAQSAERWISVGASFAEVYPEARDVVDADDVMRGIARDLGIQASSIRDENQVKKVRDAREAERKAIVEAETAEQVGKGAKAQAEAAAAQPVAPA